jgi:galactokinase
MSRTFFAPGRVNLIGEHTDYSGGLVLPAALELGITLACEPAGRIELVSDQGGRIDVAADGSGEAEGWGRYVAAVAAELAALGRADVGVAGTLASDLPVGAGLSSSAALEVVVALALCAVAELELPTLELALLCQRAEQRAVGVPCGIMDQAASLLGEPGCAVLIDTSTLYHETVPLPDGYVLLIVDSGVAHAHETGGYALRRAELERGDPARVRHVVSENERVRRTVTALRAEPPDLAAVGELFRAGHESLRDDFEVTTPELDLLVDLAYEHGATAARMTGGGFGGSIVALVAEELAANVAGKVTEAYELRTGIAARSLVTRAAAGAREVLPSNKSR